MSSANQPGTDSLNEPTLSNDEMSRFRAAFRKGGIEFAVDEDELISDYGDSDDCLYLMLSGEALVEVPAGDRWLNVALLRTGTVIGEISFLDSQPRTARVRARTACRLFRIDRESFDALSETDATSALEFVHKISRILAYRLRRIEQFDAVEQGRREMRTELAADLHDSTMNDLSGILMNLGLLKFSLGGDSDNQKTLTEVDGIVSMVKHADQTLRNLVREKAHDDITLRGLEGTIDDFLVSLSRGPMTRKVTIEFKSKNLSYENIPGHMAEDIFQIVRQSVVNANHHSDCSTIDLSLSWDDAGISFSVKDDGIGFNPDNISNVPGSGHFGLLNLKLRAERIGGSVDFETGSGKGTNVYGFAPLTRKLQDDRQDEKVRNYVLDPSTEA
ncbi:MAG: cyclic nucleotide-binding domain-containing protein [SAR202 cluster bacterium]|nr:cyclic nucleotide-binding domain-containing protein [SAR202 cluster bacterium]